SSQFNAIRMESGKKKIWFHSPRRLMDHLRQTRHTVLFFRLRQFDQHTKILQCSGVAGNFCAARDLLEQSPHDLTAARFWERFSKAHFIWFRDGGNMRADVIA